jgi:hypothetical protein
MIVLCLEKALSYDDPEATMIRDGTMRNSRRCGSTIHPIDCKPVQGRLAQSKPTRVARHFGPRGRYLSGATPIRSQAALPVFVCRASATMI